MRWVVQAYRAGVLVGMLLLIHFAGSGGRGEALVEISTGDLAGFYEVGALLGGEGVVAGSREVVSGDGGVLGFVVRTAPGSDRFVGYSGATDSLLAFDGEGKLLGWRVLSSGDTPEHLELVKGDKDFAGQFVGKGWDELAEMRGYEGVTRATLTSLAIREGISLRVSGKMPNLRFPDPVGISEAVELFPKAESMTEEMGKVGLREVLGGGGEVLGFVFRTAYQGDRVRGFQAPTDVLVALEADRETVIAIRVRSSLDNEPYVGDMKFDDLFMGMFDGKKAVEIAGMGEDLEAEGIEGVSGATSTSFAVVESVREAMRDLLAPEESGEDEGARGWVKGRDIGLVAMLGMALVMSFTRLRGTGWLRVIFQVGLLVYVGFLHGDMISQALLVGWAKSGVAWETTLGLAVLVGASFVVPWATGHQLYCHHFCPHGAAQQLLGKMVPWRVKVPAKVGRVLEWVPGLLVVGVVLVGVLGWRFNLSALEPFDAYALWFAGGVTVTVTVVVAVLGLVASAFVPMAYCRYGCPTGAVLKFVRKSGGGFGRRDWAGLGLVVLAGVLLVI